MASSNEQLVAYLAECNPAIAAGLCRLLRSRLCRQSMRIAADHPSPEAIPASGTPERTALAEQLVQLLGWYGSNAVAYTFRRVLKKNGAASYYSIAFDVAKVLRASMKKNERIDLPKAPSIAQLEELIVTMCLQSSLRDLTVEELEQLFTEAGLESDAAKAAAKSYSPGLLAGGIPALAALLGKKTVTKLVEQTLVTVTAKFLGKRAATTLANQLVVRVPQKVFLKLVSGIGLLLLGLDIILFAISPARRITLKAVAFIATSRMRDRLNLEASVS